jgi:hypothetical protein
MNYVKKMILVPQPDAKDETINNDIPPNAYNIPVDNLQLELSNVLERDDIPLGTRISIYNQMSQRLLQKKNKLVQPSLVKLSPAIQTNVVQQSSSKTTSQPISKSTVKSKSPTTKLKIARTTANTSDAYDSLPHDIPSIAKSLMLDIIDNNFIIKDGELYDKNKRKHIPKSSLSDILAHMFSEHETKAPHGTSELVAYLSANSFPQEYIVNQKIKRNYIRPSNRSSRSKGKVYEQKGSGWISF